MSPADCCQVLQAILAVDDSLEEAFLIIDWEHLAMHGLQAVHVTGNSLPAIHKYMCSDLDISFKPQALLLHEFAGQGTCYCKAKLSFARCDKDQVLSSRELWPLKRPRR